MSTSSLSDRERGFVARRRRAARVAPWLSGAALLVWLGLFAWLASRLPVLVQPLAVFAALERDELDPATVHLLASMAPLLVWALFGLVVSLLLTLLAINLQERRLLILLDRLHDTPAR